MNVKATNPVLGRTMPRPTSSNPLNELASIGKDTMALMTGKDDMQNAAKAAVAVINDPALLAKNNAMPEAQQPLHRVYQRVAQGTPRGWAKTPEFTNAVAGALVNVVKDPKTSPAHKEAARAAYTQLQYSGVDAPYNMPQMPKPTGWGPR